MELNATNSSFDQEDELPWALPKSYHAIFFCLYYASTLLSIVGNVLVIVVLVIRKRLSVGVRWSLINLAIADLLSAMFCIPLTFTQQVYGYWRYSAALCTINRFTDRVTVIVSALTLLAIGIDRYLAILYPLKFLCIRSNRAVIIRTVVLWMVTIGFCSAILVCPNIDSSPYKRIVTLNMCYTQWPSYIVGTIWAWVYLTVAYVGPLIILTFVYSSIAWKLYNRTSPGNVDVERDLRLHHSNIKVVKMLVLTVASFILCWSPMLILSILTWGDSNFLSSLDEVSQVFMYLTFQWMSTVNSFIDPAIYCFSSNNFWGDLKYIFWSIFKKMLKNESTKQEMRLRKDCANTVPLLSLSSKKKG